VHFKHIPKLLKQLDSSYTRPPSKAMERDGDANRERHAESSKVTRENPGRDLEQQTRELQAP
jgi:hypothetical protein